MICTTENLSINRASREEGGSGGKEAKRGEESGKGSRMTFFLNVPSRHVVIIESSQNTSDVNGSESTTLDCNSFFCVRPAPALAF